MDERVTRVDPESRPKWERLGRLLAERRARLDPRFAVRKTFAETVAVHSAILRDIETAARDNYTAPTLATVEAAYRWAPGSIDRVLEGGDPIEVAHVTGTTALAATAHATAEAEVVRADSTEGLLAAMRELAKRLPPNEVRALLQEFAPTPDDPDNPYTDETDRAVWRLPGLTPRQREIAVLQIRALREVEAERARQPGAEVRQFRQRAGEQ